MYEVKYLLKGFVLIKKKKREKKKERFDWLNLAELCFFYSQTWAFVRFVDLI